MKSLITRLNSARHYAFYILSIVCLVWLAQPGYRLDRTWSDLNLMAQEKPASEDFVLLQITEEDLQQLGGSPLSRDVFARILERLHDARISRVLIDTSFVSEMDQADDLRLESAFEKLGPERVAFDAGIGFENASVPAKFAEHVTLVDTRLMTDKDRRTRAITLPAFETGANPSVWLATGELDPRPIRFDLRIDPQSFQRRTMFEALSSDLSAFEGKKIVIARHAKVATTNVNFPLLGVGDRGTALLWAAATIDAQSQDRLAWEDRLKFTSLFILTLLGVCIGSRAERMRTIILSVVGTSVAAVSVGQLVISMLGVPAYPALAFAGFSLGLITSITLRFRLPQMFAAFAKGDLSPEDAWLWRTYLEHPKAVLLFGPDGTVRRANAATEKLELPMETLALDLMPQLGHRNLQVKVACENRDKTLTLEAEWPHASIPLVILTDITQSVSEQQALVDALNTDSLTGLLNRRGFDERLQASAATGKGEFAIFYIDMNGFKAVNDTYGHDAGDELLKIAAKRFVSAVRGQDKVARLGGDEFAVLVPQKLTELRAKQIANALETSLARPVKLSNVTVHVGAAVGIGLPVRDDEPVEQVVKRADAAMYKRKRELKGLDTAA